MSYFLSLSLSLYLSLTLSVSLPLVLSLSLVLSLYLSLCLSLSVSLSLSLSISLSLYLIHFHTCALSFLSLSRFNSSTVAVAAVELIPLTDRLMDPNLPGPSHFCRPSWPSFMADSIVKEKVYLPFLVLNCFCFDI